MKWLYKPFHTIGFIITLITTVLLFQRLLTPKYMSHTFEGAMGAEYYSERLPHDVIFIGDCEVYSSYSPITLWKEYGVTSYIRGGAQQLIWQSYYILEDTLRYETPKAVVLNVLSMQYSEPVSEGYNRLNLDTLRMSKTKLDAVNASVMESESVFSYILPVVRWHSRWNDLSAEDFLFMFSKKRVTHSGYMMRSDIKPVGALPTKRVLADYEFSEKCYSYLDKITDLCKSNNISLILVKSPAVYPYWHKEWNEQIQSYAHTNGLLFLNLYDLSDEIGIDMNADTFDAGIHFNVYGAEKNALYLGKVIKNFCGLRGHADQEEIYSVWDEKTLAYNTMKAIQQAEFKEYGKILTYSY